ncbi:MAG: hypothetical protein ACREDD_11060, partial [Methylocella sp.]
GISGALLIYVSYALGHGKPRVWSRIPPAKLNKISEEGIAALYTRGPVQTQCERRGDKEKLR